MTDKWSCLVCFSPGIENSLVVRSPSAAWGHGRNWTFSNCKLQLTSKLHAWNQGAPSFPLGCLNSKPSPYFSFQTRLPFWFCYFCQQHLDSSKNRAWNSLLTLPWLAPPPSPLVWTLKQLLSVPTTWQFILINTAPVKWLKGKCLYSLPSQRLGTPYGKGWGLSLCWMPHKADLQKLQRYLFINSINRHLVSLHSEHSAQHLHSGALGSVSLHSIKGRAGGSPENSASAGLIYSLDHLRWTGNWDLFPPKKEVYWEAPHLPLPPKETSEKRNIRC